MTADEKTEKLIDLIYDAAIDNKVWCEVLTQIADLIGSEGGVLFGQSWRTQSVYFDYNGRLSEACNEAYQERHVDNPWNRYMSRQAVGNVVYSDEILALADLRKTAFYDEVLRPQKIGHNAMVALASASGFQAAFNICRTQKQGFFAERERHVLSILVPHMKRSITLGLRSNAYNALGQAAFEVIERLPDGVVVLDGKLRTIYANPQARRIEATGALRLCSGLSCKDAAVAQKIQTLLCDTVRGSGGALSFSASYEDQTLLTLLAAPMRGRIARQLQASNVNDPAALVFIVDIAKRRQFALEQIRQAYGLTWSEARVALGVGGGASATQLARATNLSPSTIKTHLRNVFAKTATQRQSELARLVSALDSINLCP